MKSYKDKQLMFKLLLLAIAEGAAGRFFETEHLSFPSAGNLNQAAAILATKENIVGIPGGAPDAPVTLGFSDSLPATADISFTRAADCGPSMAIKAYGGKTAGFLCLDAADPNFDSKVKAASAEVNALVVTPKFAAKESALRETAVDQEAARDGAAFVMNPGTTTTVTLQAK